MRETKQRRASNLGGTAHALRPWAGWLVLVVTVVAVALLLTRLPRPIRPAPGEMTRIDQGVSPAVLQVAGSAISASLTFASDAAGLLAITDSATGAPIATGVASSIYGTDGRAYHFPADFTPIDPLGYSAAVGRDPILGPSRHISAEFVSNDGLLTASIEVTISQATPALIYQLRARPQQAGRLRFALFQGTEGHLTLRAPADYLSILSSGHISRRLGDLDTLAGHPLPAGSPLLLWSDEDRRGYVIGTLDEVVGSSFVSSAFADGDELRIVINAGSLAADPVSSPRVYLERTTQREPQLAFAGFRSVLDVLAPAPPIPPSFRHQWDSWYVYYGGIDEQRIRDQIDAIAAGYADLGPWQVIIDAGWYRTGADPDGEMGVVDTDRFPSGMRALVDYAHQRGVGVLLYASAPWVDSRPSVSSWWMVQQGFVRDHADLLILVQEHEDGNTYVYDFDNPALRAYLDGVIRRYMVDFNADGILLDMVGIIGDIRGPLQGEPPTPALRSVQRVAQTMEVYRFFWESATRYKADAWVEGAWAAPPLARRYAQTWRYGDEYPAFSNPYPFGGLLEHLTFGILQEQMLGRRAHLGFVYGDDGTWPLQRQWLAAAVALQRQVALSTDLRFLPPAIARMYREYLTALRPFSTQPTYGPGIPAEWFFTQVSGTTYLGLLNPGQEPREYRLSLAEIGFPAGRTAVAFDPATREAIPMGEQFTITVPAATFRLLTVRTEPGVMWADRGWTTSVVGQDLIVRVQAAPINEGRVWVYPGRARTVQVDGVTQRPLREREHVVQVEIPDGRAHEVRLRLARGRS